MRLGIIGETLIERVIARTNVAPVPLLETQIAFTMARSIMAGVKLGIYDAIGTGAKTVAEVVTACNTDREATTKLLNTLVGCRYLRHRDGRYELTPKASKWLLQSTPDPPLRFERGQMLAALAVLFVFFSVVVGQSVLAQGSDRGGGGLVDRLCRYCCLPRISS
jgi:hypothetical protein